MSENIEFISMYLTAGSDSAMRSSALHVWLCAENCGMTDIIDSFPTLPTNLLHRA